MAAGATAIPFSPGWDALDRLTVRFRDAELERQYETQLLETRRRRQRMATLGGSAIFLAVAVLAPPLIGVPLWPLIGILFMLTVVNVAAAVLAMRSSTSRQLGAVGIWVQLTTGFLLLLLVSVTDTFIRFAVPCLMVIAIFAFGISRHPFRNAAVISGGQILDYLAYGTAQGLTPGILLDAFVLAAALVGACAGTYLAERNERRLFAQSLVVADLNRRVNELFHRYVAPEVADSVIADPARAELGGEEVEVTVLFADLIGFTAFAERVRPDVAVAMLNRAFSPRYRSC